MTKPQLILNLQEKHEDRKNTSEGEIKEDYNIVKQKIENSDTFVY